MIPKVIHYCWFGGKPLDEMGIKCKESWIKFFPDYEIIEWNETNFDINCCKYVKEAYEKKKWAFVSDYARFKILYENGGLYFDTDVEIVKSFGEILKNGSFMGCEVDGRDVEDEKSNSEKKIAVNPGLGIAAVPGLNIYKELLDFYERISFINKDGSLNTTTIVEYTTDLLMKKGLKDVKGIQKIEEITIYPKAYFNPYNWGTGEINVTSNSYSIHHFAGSWTTKRNKINKKIFHMLTKILNKLKVLNKK